MNYWQHRCRCCPSLPNGPLNYVNSNPLTLRAQLRRAAYLRHILETYQSDEDNKPHDAPIWESWLRQNGELPLEYDDS